MAHGRPDELAIAREKALYRKVSNRQMAKPPVLFFSEGWDSRPFRPIAECADRFEVTRPTVSQWYAWVEFRDSQERARESWNPSGDLPDHWLDLSVEDVPSLVEDISVFRGKYFRDRRRNPYVTPKFQREWLTAMLTALLTGGRLNILSPPRHGKTELCIHFAVWLIVHWPSILILWVGGNEKIAKRATGQVMQILATNKDLIDDFAGPGRTFRPGMKDGLPWSTSEFTVATSPEPAKGRTMTAIGRGGTLLSLDADLVVEDDIEDHGSTVQPNMRESTKDWQATQLESRKEEHTGIINIGSRQHPDDLASHLLENVEWTSIVETAHNLACMIPEADEEAHVDCMLFPEVRSYRWLKQQERSFKRKGKSAGLFRMVYLNEATAEGLQVFTPEIVDPCLSANHVIGRLPKEPGRLVAGLDPSGAAGFQAAVLVWYTVNPTLKIFVIDIDNTRGGGLPQLARIVKEWYDKYQASHWIIESNLHQGLLTQDRDLRTYASSHNIYLEDWKTHLNKLDQNVGVTSMQPWFANRQIILPFGDLPSQEKTRELRDQLIYWDGNAPRNRNKSGLHTDLVMALWFCKEPIRRALMDHHVEMGVDQSDPFTSMYQGFHGLDWDTAPWAS